MKLFEHKAVKLNESLMPASAKPNKRGGYVRIIMQPKMSGSFRSLLTKLGLNHDKGINSDGYSDEFTVYYKNDAEFGQIDKVVSEFNRSGNKIDKVIPN